MRKLLLLAGAVAAALGAGGWWYWQKQTDATRNYRTVALERGPFLAAIGATGTIEPEEVIDVGAQVAGRIDRFGIDPRSQALRHKLTSLDLLPLPGPRLLLGGLAPTKAIDYGSPVEQGTTLAQLDPSLFETRVERYRADLEKARADQYQLQAKLEQAEQEWRRARELLQRKAISPSEFDLARAAYDSAMANLNVGQAAIAQASATLKEAEINLGYTIIRSPVKGVIVDRRVNVGQTVVASLNAPSLFLIAKDLNKLQVWASVNEADIGQIRPGQDVRFTVDAHPNDIFYGVVAQDQPRLNASMTQNVVTYTVVVNTDNSQGKLIPYLTANLQFIVSQRSSALLLPNAALRWRPQVRQVVPEHRAAFRKLLRQRKTAAALAAEKGSAEKTVWVVAENNLVRPVHIVVGLTDGMMTEIIGGDLEENDLVVESDESRGDDDGQPNPFAPSIFGGNKKQQ